MNYLKTVIKSVVLNYRKAMGTFKWLVFQIIKEDFKNYLRNDNRNSKLVILANGPSLKGYLKDFRNRSKDCDYCVVNFFANHNEFFTIRPNHYVLADPTFFDGRALEIPAHIQLKSNLNKVDWKMVVYVPFGKHKYMRKHIDNPNITFLPFHYNPY